MNVLNKCNPLQFKTAHGQKISSALFYLSFWGYVFCTTYYGTNLLHTDKKMARLLLQISWLCVYCAVANILFFSDYSLKQLLYIAAVLGIFYISFSVSRSRHLLQGFILVFSAKRINWHRFIISNTCFYPFLLLSIFICNRIGLISSLNFPRGNLIRTDMGFSHPNVLGAYLMIICMSWMIVRYEKLIIYDYFVFAAIIAYIWIGPNSRSSALTLTLMVLALPFFKKQSHLFRQKIIHTFISLSYLLGFFASYICALLYNAENSLLTFIDRMLSGRISLANIFLQNYPSTLFGQKLKLVSSAQSSINGSPSAILDNAYIRMYLETGIIPTMVFLCIMTATIYYLISKEQYSLVLCLCLFAVYSLFEYRISKISVNFLLLTVVLPFQNIFLEKKKEQH